MRWECITELLAEKGSIYVHCDWRVNSHLRVALDEIFGNGNFRNEIIWTFGGKGMANVKKNYFRNQNSILFYSKTGSIKPNLKSGIVSQSVIDRFGKYMNDNYQVILGSCETVVMRWKFRKQLLLLLENMVVFQTMMTLFAIIQKVLF